MNKNFMLPNLISDINTESVLKAFSSRASISIAEFYHGPYFNNVTEANYSGLKLSKTIDSLLNGGYIETLKGYDTTVWKITSKGTYHLEFLETPYIRKIEPVKNVVENPVYFKPAETGSRINISLKAAIHFLLTPVLHLTNKKQKI